MLALWDVCLLRGDRFLGFFLSLALLLHHKTELLSLQGPALRAAVETLFTNGRTPVLQASPHTAFVPRLARFNSVNAPNFVCASADILSPRSPCFPWPCVHRGVRVLRMWV
jgi:hypothetical protein